MNRKWLFRTLVFAGFSFMVGFSYKYHLPKFEQFLLIEVERLSKKHLPVKIFASNLSFHLLPLGIVMDDVRVVAKPPLHRYLAPTHLKQVGARISLWPLMRGEIRLARLFIRDSELNLFLRPELFENSEGGRKNLNFGDIYKLPIDEISFERIQVQGRLLPENLVFRISDFNLLIENRYRSLFVELEAPSVLLKPSGPIDPLNLQVELRTLVEADEAQISAFKLRADQSFVVASGRLSGDFSSGQIKNGAIDARIKLLLPDLNHWESIFRQNLKLPELNGLAELDIGTELRDGKAYRFEGELKTSDLIISKYVIGTVEGNVSSDLKSISSERLRFENNAGRVVLREMNLTLGQTPEIKAQVKAERIDLTSLLRNIGIKNVPVHLPFRGEAFCQGVWNNAPALTCKGQIGSPRLNVYQSRINPETIIEVLNLNANGEAKVTLNEVEYAADVKVGQSSKGRSSGIINYQNGFKIKYEGDHVDFADVKNLAGLKLEGSGKLNGSTEGNAKTAAMQMQLNGKKIWFENYPLGDLNAKVAYQDGHLTFNDAQGQYEVSRYNGKADIDLRHRRLKVSAQIPFADLKDIQSIFQRKTKLPFSASGTGQGKLEAHGPLNFQDLSYDLRSSFFRGQIANEAFDEFVFNVKSVNGLVRSERVTLTKSSGVAELKGQINRKGEIDTVVVARGMRIEQSENILAMGLDAQGMADFSVLVRGQLPQPHIELNGRFSRVVLGDQPAEDSVVKLNFLADRMEGSGQFLGQTLITDFTWPFQSTGPFMLKAKARKWDFLTLFSLVSRSARQLDFASLISGEINLQAQRGGFWGASGEVKIDQLMVRKGAKRLAANKPMLLTMRDGVINSKNFAIQESDNLLKLDVNGLSRNALNASLNGKLDISLLGLFTPFISDLRGLASIAMDLRGSVSKPMLSGSAYVDKGYAKLADFIHPFSNIRADLLFNGNQIVINSLRTDVAGGKLSGDGKMSFNGSSRPVDIKATFKDAKLNVPEGFRTNGYGSVAVYGSTFPYTMDIDYSISGGEITYEIGEDTTTSTNVKASAYLPRFMYQEAFHPFSFMINANLRNPLAINNSLIQASINGSLKATGTPDRLVLSGTLTPLPGAKIFFRDVPFEVNSAFVEYNNAPPKSPKIYLTAAARVSESVQDDQLRTTEHQYDVSLLVQGRGPSPEIILNSQPPLSQREIVSLLALGVTTKSLDERRSSQSQAANTSTAVGAGILQKAAGRRIKDTFGVDVKVSSSQPTPENASLPKVTISKQWTPKLGASASSTLQANPSNNVKIEYKMNKNVSVIGSWDGRENNVADQKDDKTKNVFGLDLEYKVQFK